MRSKKATVEQVDDEDYELLDLGMKRRGRPSGRPTIEIPSGRRLTTSPVSTPPRERFTGEPIYLSGQISGLRKRVDSINLLKSLHGCNTLPDDEEPLSHGSPGHRARLSPDYGPDSPAPRPTRMTRVDSKTLLHKMNNLNTSPEGILEEDDSPRKSKIRELNERYAKLSEGSAGEDRSSNRSELWRDKIETTTYFESVQNRAPMLERRDSITLQHALGGQNTVFGVHSESPRWKKVAALNKKRIKKKMEKKKVEIAAAASPAKVEVGLSMEDDDDDECGEQKEERKDEEEEKSNGVWATTRSGRRSQMESIELHDKTGGVNTADTRAQRSRNRVDSIQLQKSHQGSNTAETFVVPAAPPLDNERKKGDTDVNEEDCELRSRFFGGGGAPSGSLSPRLVRVRELNKKFAERDDSNLDLKRDDRNSASTRGSRKSAPNVTFN